MQRYLIENRWNNIVHHTLEKICEIVVSKNLNIIVNKYRKYVTDGFLGTLIENFTNRNHIFLNTFNFTTQGTTFFYERKFTFSLCYCQKTSILTQKQSSASIFDTLIRTMEKVSDE